MALSLASPVCKTEATRANSWGCVKANARRPGRGSAGQEARGGRACARHPPCWAYVGLAPIYAHQTSVDVPPTGKGRVERVPCSSASGKFRARSSTFCISGRCRGCSGPGFNGNLPKVCLSTGLGERPGGPASLEAHRENCCGRWRESWAGAEARAEVERAGISEAVLRRTRSFPQKHLLKPDYYC